MHAGKECNLAAALDLSLGLHPLAHLLPIGEQLALERLRLSTASMLAAASGGAGAAAFRRRLATIRAITTEFAAGKLGGWFTQVGAEVSLSNLTTRIPGG